MRCPNCKETMQFVTHEKQIFLHCINCGCSFFDQNVINRISLPTAEKLAKDMITDEISPFKKFCPRDLTKLNSFQSEAVPPEVILLKCDKCKGILVYPEDLLKFKKAQQTKIEYFKLWKIPFPSIQTVTLISIIMLISVLSFTTFVYWQQQNVSHIQAQDLIKNIYITSQNHYLFISFETQIPVVSKLVFNDKTAETTIEKTINSTPSVFHQLTTGDVNLTDEVYYQIVLTDNKRNVTKTDMKRLEIK